MDMSDYKNKRGIPSVSDIANIRPNSANAKGSVTTTSKLPTQVQTSNKFPTPVQKAPAVATKSNVIAD